MDRFCEFLALAGQKPPDLAKFLETHSYENVRLSSYIFPRHCARCWQLKKRSVHGQITEKQAEQIALAKIPGGKIRTAELQTANGAKFWSVYVTKLGSKNAKEVRIDAATGKIFNVQTEKPEDQAEEPPKTH